VARVESAVMGCRAPVRLGHGRRQRRRRTQAGTGCGRIAVRRLRWPNKECLVCAGDFFMQPRQQAGACILPAIRA